MNNANYHLSTFASQSELAQQLAADIVQKIQQAIEKKGKALIAFSGGSTPKLMFQALAHQTSANQAIDWSKVIITLVDERWVPIEHELSNHAFIEKNLLDHLPDVARFISLYQVADSVEGSLPLVLDDFYQAAELKVEQEIIFDVVILGMGGDGHTASFFPDASNIKELVDPMNSKALLSCESPSTQVPRITWSLPVLLNSKNLILHIVGKPKQQVFVQALQNDNALELPIRSILFQEKQTLNVYYAD